MMAGKHGAGKGDTYRPVDQKKWSENWDAIFGNKPKNKKLTQKKVKKSK
jgi:predicted SnoaL-like aldol condensation-catalyzing enzyme